VKLYIIPMFIPHYGCQHQCVFCDQRAITGQNYPVLAEDVAKTIKQHLDAIDRPYKIEVAFYGGSFTALPSELQLKLLAPAKEALDRGLIQAIRLSTRPDAISVEIALRLKKNGVQTVELGAQSMDDRVLMAAKRGHSAAAVENAVGILKKVDIKCGLQLMPGLPKEDWISLIKTGQRVVELHPDIVRIYPTVVIKNTPLAELFSQGQYKPLTLSAAVSRSAYLKLLFEQHEITVIRTGLQATEGLSEPGKVLAGPYHPAFGEMVEAFLYSLMVSLVIEKTYPIFSQKLTIHHHPKDHSKVRGISNTNLQSWRAKYGIKECFFIPDWNRQGELVIHFNGLTSIVNKTMLFT